MTPRRYDMSARGAAVQETRRRILEATLELHTERGIFGTSWKDIAERADVAVGTVYRHFPSLSELVPACGELLMELTHPPSPEDAAEMIGAATDPVERLERAAREVFAFYDRAGASLESDPRERELPEMQEWETYWRATVGAFVQEAIGASAVDPEALAFVCALLDPPAFRSFRERGLATDAAAHQVARAIARHLDLSQQPKRRTT